MKNQPAMNTETLQFGVNQSTSRTELDAAKQDYAQLMLHRQQLEPHPALSGSQAPDGRIYHRHHILPKSIFPDFAAKRWNIVLLSLPEHFIAHQKLACAMPEEPANHQALSYMKKRYVHHLTSDDGELEIDWLKVEESERIANAAASALQSTLRREDWLDPVYAERMSALRRHINKRNWQDESYRQRQTEKIKCGRRKKFYSNPTAVARATRAQAAKTSGKKHWKFRPLNIYRHADAALVASGVCLSEFCKKHALNHGHLYATLRGDRTQPGSDGNRVQCQGYFARELHDDGTVKGLVCGPVPKKDHQRARRADIFRASDGVCIAEAVIISQFCANNTLNVKLHQGALSRTAHSDHSQPSTRHNPHFHKGFYARYEDNEKNI